MFFLYSSLDIIKRENLFLFYHMRIPLCSLQTAKTLKKSWDLTTNLGPKKNISVEAYDYSSSLIESVHEKRKI